MHPSKLLLVLAASATNIQRYADASKASSLMQASVDALKTSSLMPSVWAGAAAVVHGGSL
jgi:hypothetical protein